jgi:hypothetical protein
MRFDQQALGQAQRRAYAALTAPAVATHVRVKGEGMSAPSIKKEVSANNNYADPKLTTSPAMLIQELPWVNSTQQFIFDYSINGPQQTPGVNNNIVIGKNDVFAIYGVQMLFATGTNSAAFVYRSHGVLPNDDSAYNSFIQMKIETNTFIDKMEGQFFRDNPANSNEYFGEIGLQLINPIRVVNGELGTFKIFLNLKNPISSLVISANTMLSMRLHGVYGQAKG